MTPLKVGILSDTHLNETTDLFQKQIDACFSGIPIILHAGDLVEKSILKVFADREVHAVSGNMCLASSRKAHQESKIITLKSFTCALTHGAGWSHNIEDRLFREFMPVDCIVYGHTHSPVCHQVGPVLFINPGCFMRRSRYGRPGTYAIMEVGETLKAQIFEVPDIP